MAQGGAAASIAARLTKRTGVHIEIIQRDPVQREREEDKQNKDVNMMMVTVRISGDPTAVTAAKCEVGLYCNPPSVPGGASALAPKRK